MVCTGWNWCKVRFVYFLLDMQMFVCKHCFSFSLDFKSKGKKKENVSLNGFSSWIWVQFISPVPSVFILQPIFSCLIHSVLIFKGLCCLYSGCDASLLTLECVWCTFRSGLPSAPLPPSCLSLPLFCHPSTPILSTLRSAPRAPCFSNICPPQ